MKKVFFLFFMLMGFFLHGESIDISKNQWKLIKNTGDKGSLLVKDNCLQLDFDAIVKKEFQFGHVRVRQAVYTIALGKPIKLDKNQTRIFFTAKGIQQLYRRSRDSFHIFPVIRDESGEEFTYTAYPEAYLGNLWRSGRARLGAGSLGLLHACPGWWRLCKSGHLLA